MDKIASALVKLAKGLIAAGMKKVKTENGYDFYVGEEGGKEFYNIVPSGSKPPTSGYFDKQHIEKVKGERFGSKVAGRAVKYKGYTIEPSGMNFYVTDPSGHRVFEEVPASIETAKKWIDMDLRERQGSIKVAISFRLGQVVATPGALEALEDAGQDATEFLRRHQRGDWGDVGHEDKKANDDALNPTDPQRLLSSYRTRKGVKIWVITEWDRSVTTVLLPDEY